MTVRGKTTPASSAGSFAAHTRSAPETSLESSPRPSLLDGAPTHLERPVLITGRHGQRETTRVESIYHAFLDQAGRRMQMDAKAAGPMGRAQEAAGSFDEYEEIREAEGSASVALVDALGVEYDELYDRATDDIRERYRRTRRDAPLF